MHFIFLGLFWFNLRKLLRQYLFGLLFSHVIFLVKKCMLMSEKKWDKSSFRGSKYSWKIYKKNRVTKTHSLISKYSFKNNSTLGITNISYKKNSSIVLKSRKK
jgi:hypothetical protein